MSKRNRNKIWLDCTPENARRILLMAFGRDMLARMIIEHGCNPPVNPTQNWIKWLMHILERKEDIR